MRKGLAGLLALAMLPVLVGPSAGANAQPHEGDDVTVIAVIDSGITPYHWDFLASKVPGGPDVPLDRPPHEYLEGFPAPKTFASYESLDLTFEEKDEHYRYEALAALDRSEWGTVKTSKAGAINYYWIPGTKIIGAVDFGTDRIYADTNAHGTGAASVAVGNLHGTCPDCLLVFIDTGGFSQAQTEAALEWAEGQPWIDAISNSYGHSTVFTDNVYDGSDTDAQRRATERGQSVFFAAHNGHDRSFVVPNNPLMSSQPGPDWIITVGAVDPVARASYSGHGKPADISSIGSGYPSAYGSPSVGGEGDFGGTSNATPVLTGIYGRALYEVRRALAGTSRVQRDGVIARGLPITCGSKRARCELDDGVLTRAEFITRFFEGAIHTDAGTNVGGFGNVPPTGEEEFLAEGHGTYVGLLDGKATLLEELGRILDPMFGRAATIERPSGEKEWMIVDSFCRQHLWGSWKGGYYIDGKAELPGASEGWPLRSAIETACPNIPPF